MWNWVRWKCKSSSYKFTRSPNSQSNSNILFYWFTNCWRFNIDPSNPAGLTIQIFDDYDPNDASVGNELDTTVALIDGQKYYIQVTNSDGCVSEAKSETKVVLSNPVLTASIAESCPGEEITIDINGVPQTALDFELANPTLQKILEYNNSTYFVDPVSRTFSATEELIPSYGDGASLYQINSVEEHDAVYKQFKMLE